MIILNRTVAPALCRRMVVLLYAYGGSCAMSSNGCTSVGVFFGRKKWNKEPGFLPTYKGYICIHSKFIKTKQQTRRPICQHLYSVPGKPKLDKCGVAVT